MRSALRCRPLALLAALDDTLERAAASYTADLRLDGQY